MLEKVVEVVSVSAMVFVSVSKAYDIVKMMRKVKTKKEYNSFKEVLGHVLFETGFITKRSLEEALDNQKESHSKLLNTMSTINAGLYSAVISKLISTNINTKKQSKEFDITISEMLVTSKAKQSSIAYLLVFIAALVHFVTSILTVQIANSYLFSFLCIVILLIHLNQKVLQYRIENGFYGKNDYEAREMISFLLEHADKTDFSDGDGLKKLFPQTRESENRQEIYGGVVGVSK